MRVALVVLLMLTAAACSGNGGGPTSPKRRAAGEAVPVTVATAAERPMPLQLRVVGTV